MSREPVIIAEEDMRKLLDSGKRPPRWEHEKTGQLTATWDVLRAGEPTGVIVKVYTSVFKGSGESRGLGEDSIRVAVVDTTAKRGVGKASLTQRTVGWESRLIDKVKAMFEHAYSIPNCKRCGKRMALRENKRDGTEFWGCTGYPDCNATQPVGASANP